MWLQSLPGTHAPLFPLLTSVSEAQPVLLLPCYSSQRGTPVLFLSKTGRDQHIVGGFEKRRFSLMRNGEQIWFPNLNFLLHRNDICI